MSFKKMGQLKYLIFLGLIELVSCTTKEPFREVYVSPTGQFTIAVQIGDEGDINNKHEIFFKLLRNDGKQLDIARTKASAVMNYAVFWDNDKTVVLYSSDIGVYAWRVTTDEKIVPAPVDYKLEKKAVEVFNKKMGR